MRSFSAFKAEARIFFDAGLPLMVMGCFVRFGAGDLRRQLLPPPQFEKAEITNSPGPRSRAASDDLGEPVEHLVDALFVELGKLRKLRYNLRLGQPFASHLGSSSFTRGYAGATTGPITSGVRARKRKGAKIP
jgi:hypothetical protein